MNDLMTQLQVLIDNAEASQTDAAKWRELIYLLGELGYGPRITPQQIVALVPDPENIRRLVSDTQEVGPSPADASKMARRKLTADDRTAIHQLAAQDYTAANIAAALGIARTAVEKELAAAEH